MDLVLGELSSPELAEIEAHLATCAPCRAERDELLIALEEMPLSLPPAPPSSALFARMDASIHHLERFASFAPRLAELLALSKDDARRALHVYDKPEAMTPTARPGMRAETIPPGPGKAGMTALFACFDPGCLVAEHYHDREEHVIVFQGAFRTDDGVVVGPGQELVSPKGTSHTLRILDGDPCLCAILKSDPGIPT